MSAIDEIKSRIDILDLVSETVQLRRSGKNYVGFCPFHPNSRTPAFVVFPDSGTWRCFGQCNEGGDAFRFVMKKEGWDFPETLRFLAEKTGVVLEPLTPQRAAEEEAHEVLRGLLDEAVVFFQYQLNETAPGRAARAYLHKRGLTDVTIAGFGLGYGPESWDALTRHFTQKGYPVEDLLRAGLVTERDSGGVYDRFRHRITFPIRDAAGKMSGFGARILNPEDQPKFLNSPQTELFDKGRLLYGLDLARKPIRAADQVVIVEGYLDVIALHQAGFANTVSPMGTALTEDQMRLLKRFTRRIVLALDADAAGQKATLRGLEVARQAMDHADELTFDARGLLRHEGRLQADLRVTTLPDGMDPDEVALRDPAEWAHIVESARPVVVHVMETLAAGQDLEDPKVKSAVAAQVLPLIGDVADPIERDAYRQRLARLLKVDERALEQGGPAPARQGRPRPSRAGQAKNEPAQPAPGLTRGPALQLEKHLLRLLLRSPESIHPANRLLQKAGLEHLTPLDFDQADHQVLVRLVESSLEQDALEPPQFIQENLPDSLREETADLLKELPGGEPAPEKLVEHLVRGLVRLRSDHLRQTAEQLQMLQREVAEDGTLRLEAYDQEITRMIDLRLRLDRALRSPLIVD